MKLAQVRITEPAVGQSQAEPAVSQSQALGQGIRQFDVCF
jgi:hypothetical protein